MRTLTEKAHQFITRDPVLAQDGKQLAEILSVLHCDEETVCAALTYPFAQKNPALLDAIKTELNPAVAHIISGALQMDMIHRIQTDKTRATAQQNQIDNLRKMMLSMVDDLRTIYLKLAARLLLMKNAKMASPTQRQLLAEETLNYYVPLANRLGIGHIKWQLEDWSFRYANPLEYQRIAQALQMRHKDRVEFIHKMITQLKKILSDGHLAHAKISGRVKHIYSIHKKIERKKVSFEEIYDTNAIRILVPTIDDCYHALSLVHDAWKPIKSEFDDYIAKPKQNGYQSVHTAITLPHGIVVEIQIRTIEMHERAELGVAAHWSYKENKITTANEAEKIAWLRTLLDWQKTALMDSKKQQEIYQKAFLDRIYVFSPAGNIFDLNAGSTPLDFAYLIHTSIGHRCRGAKVNGVLVPLTHILKTGDRIEILTNKEPHPSPDWLRKNMGFLTSQHAIRKVRHWFNQQLLTQSNQKPSVSAERTEIEKPKTKITQKKKIKTVANKPARFSISGEKYLLTQIAKCCLPKKGDDIIGYVTLGRGISVHKKNCHNVDMARERRPEKLIDIHWD